MRDEAKRCEKGPSMLVENEIELTTKLEPF